MGNKLALPLFSSFSFFFFFFTFSLFLKQGQNSKLWNIKGTFALAHLSETSQWPYECIDEHVGFEHFPEVQIVDVQYLRPVYGYEYM